MQTKMPEGKVMRYIIHDEEKKEGTIDTQRNKNNKRNWIDEEPRSYMRYEKREEKKTKEKEDVFIHEKYTILN